ncbi:unnamed protein product [Polarella glacialis]|uniref:Uncharacterized protein n=1 Tax=Polarella glacialis TaxID=89957 RepID=A0A813DWB9_POLGL|nr:unnamed protein product [Polarella glacialis]CAE8593759.1 unnamed protein product [Polarella glacialis]CAE8615710.1 unnamed protein product [Polarella glacialis]
MIVHGLSRGVQADGSGNFPNPGPVSKLAAAARKVDLEEDRPDQAALLLNAFARLRHAHDAELCGRIFGFAQRTLPAWDAQALTVLCNALAGVKRRARIATQQEADGGNAAWKALSARCAEVLQGAAPQHFACLAHALARVGAPSESVDKFYNTMEALLVSRPRISEFLSAMDLALLANGLARHRRPALATATTVSLGASALPEAICQSTFPAKGIAPSTTVDNNSMCDKTSTNVCNDYQTNQLQHSETQAAMPTSASSGGLVGFETFETHTAMLELEPLTKWPFEEYMGRKLREFSSQGLVMSLHASVRLRRGGEPLFEALSQRLMLCHKELQAPGLALVFSAAAEASSLGHIGLPQALTLLRGLRRDLERLAPLLSPWQVAYVASALASTGALCRRKRAAAEQVGPSLWRSHKEAAAVLEALRSRAGATIADPNRRKWVCDLLEQGVEAHSEPLNSSTGTDDLLLAGVGQKQDKMGCFIVASLFDL